MYIWINKGELMHYTHHISLCIQIKCKKRCKSNGKPYNIIHFLFITCKGIFLLFCSICENQWTQQHQHQHPVSIQYNHQTSLFPSSVMWLMFRNYGASARVSSFFDSLIFFDGLSSNSLSPLPIFWCTFNLL